LASRPEALVTEALVIDGAPQPLSWDRRVAETETCRTTNPPLT
jgi:hypothetical protein